MTSIHLFDHSADRMAVPAGGLIFSEGEPGDVMYALVAGEVDILVHGRVIETAQPGSIVGEMALIETGPRSATTRARTDCILAPVPEKQFLFLVQEHPTFALLVMKIMAERLRRMDNL